MRATIETTTDQDRRTEEAAVSAELARRDKRRIGEFVDEAGDVVRAQLARSADGEQRLLYAAKTEGPAICLGWVGDATAVKEADAIWADYLAADPADRWARPVTLEEAKGLARKGQRPKRGSGSGSSPKAETSPRLDGPGVFEWMVDAKVVTEGQMKTQFGSSRARRLNAWRGGDAATAAVVDEMLCGKGIHLSEIPDELWLSEDRKRASRQAPEIREAGARRYRAGESAQALASEYGVTAHSIRNWARKGANLGAAPAAA